MSVVAYRRRRKRGRAPKLWALVLAGGAALAWTFDLPARLPASGSTGAARHFLCAAPYNHDGDNIRCAGGPSSRLYGIDAPEMPGSCRPGRRCTPGDPYAARDHLRSLVDGRSVECRQVDTDHYDRPILRCRADGRDLSCAMVRDGYAVERYGSLDCSG